jgi:hypothetical protein
MIRLNIGHLYRKMPGFISSLSYSFDNVGTTWETAHLDGDRKNNLKAGNLNLSNPGVLQLPKTIEVSVGFTPVGVYRPEYNGVMYSLYDDTNPKVESGLMPKDATKVNYFRAFDTTEDLLTVPELDSEQISSALPGTETQTPKVDEKLREDTSKEEKDAVFEADNNNTVKTGGDAVVTNNATSQLPGGPLTSNQNAQSTTGGDLNNVTPNLTGQQQQQQTGDFRFFNSENTPNVPDTGTAIPSNPIVDPANGSNQQGTPFVNTNFGAGGFGSTNYQGDTGLSGGSGGVGTQTIPGLGGF